MTTAYSFRKSTTPNHCTKPRVIQSATSATSYGPLPPSPPHKHLQQNYQPQTVVNNNNNADNNNAHTTKTTTGTATNVSACSLDSIHTDLSNESRDVIIGEQWLVLSKIGEGSFGEVFEAEDVYTGRHYAIKREPLNTPMLQLKHESIMYDVIQGGRGMPQCQWFGEHDNFACIVMDLLGPSLKDVCQAVSHVPLRYIIEWGCQIVDMLEHIHSRGLVYRDVKPENFLFSVQCTLPDNNGSSYETMKPSCEQLFESWGTKPDLFVVDFGLATWWRDPTTDKPYPQCKRRIKHKTGTARYASLNVHRGKLHARRDDIESLGYLLLDLALGSLPWTGIKAKNSKTGWDRMRDLKEDIALDQLCYGLPLGLLEFVESARRLRFGDTPDYDNLRRLLCGSKPGGEFSKLVGTPPSPPEQPSSFSRPIHPKEHQHLQQNLQLYVNGRNREPQRRTSVRGGHYHPQQKQHGRYPLPHSVTPADNQEGVFVMDDVAHELATIEGEGNGAKYASPSQRQYQQQQAPTTATQSSFNGRRRRRSSGKRSMSNGGGRRESARKPQQHNHHTTVTPPSPPSFTSWKHQKQHKNNNGIVGWNTHKRQSEKPTRDLVPGAYWDREIPQSTPPAAIFCK
jgi:serine/threonine protein kinase